MEAFSFWKGSSFSLLEVISLWSTSLQGGFTRFTLYYDEHDHPDNRFWDAVDEIPGVVKQPVGEILAGYLNRYLSPRVAPVTDVRILADIFRYAHLHDHGGAWLDLDTLQVRDLAALMESRDFTAGWESKDYINIAVLAFPPRHPILVDLLDALTACLEGDERPFHVVGPRLMTRVVRARGLEHEVLPIPYFYPIDYRQEEAVLFGSWPLPEETHSIHVWAYLNRHIFKGKRLEDFARVRSTFFDRVHDMMGSLPHPVS